MIYSYIQGFKYEAPCLVISGLLSNFAKISAEHAPYSFYKINRSVALACTTQDDKPVTTVKLRGSAGQTDLQVVRS